MTEPQIADPEPATDCGELPADPLLGSDSFIDPARHESEQNEDAPGGEFEPGVVIAAEPISMLRPGEEAVEVTPKSSKKRNAEEMMQRPSWLPADWKIDLRVRASGATAGLIDRYYVDPTGQRTFRSRVEVLHFLETGSKKKKKSTSEADAGSSGSLASPKKTSQKKTSTKRKKSEAVISDVSHPQHVSNGVKTDTQ